MAATAVTVARPTIDGVNSPTAVAMDAANGNSVVNSRGLILTIENTDSGPRVVTFTTPVTHGEYAVADKTVTLAAAAKKNFSNFPADTFGRTLLFSTDSALVKASAMAAD